MGKLIGRWICYARVAWEELDLRGIFEGGFNRLTAFHVLGPSGDEGLLRGEGWVGGVIVRLASVGGACGGKTPLRMLGNVGLAVKQNRFISVVKTSKSKGSALLGVLKVLSGCSAKSCCLGGMLVGSLDRAGTTRCQGHVVNFVFRSFGLVSFGSTMRGITLPLFCRKVDQGGQGTLTLRCLSQLKLGS